MLLLVLVGVLSLEGLARSEDSPPAGEGTEEEAEREQEIAQEEYHVLSEDAVPVEPAEPTWKQLLKPKAFTIRWDHGLSASSATTGSSVSRSAVVWRGITRRSERIRPSRTRSGAWATSRRFAAPGSPSPEPLASG
jgi:hypothetical protein